MDLATITPQDAIHFRDHVEARLPVDLADLSFLMSRSGGPLDQMDASLDSLDPLWQWVVRMVSE